MNNSLFQNTYVRALFVIALVGVVAALGAYTYLTLKLAEGTYTGAMTISVEGEGEVLAVPDIGSFSFMVETEAATAAEAQTKGAEIVSAITGYLAEAGVAEADIKTESYNLSPKYRYDERPCPFGSYCPPVDPVQDGFTVSQYIAVKVRAVDTAGELISGVGDRGAMNISGLQFTIDDETALLAEARDAAIEEAKAEAEAVAAGLGKKLGRMVGYYEGGKDYYGYGGGDMMERQAMSAPAMDAVIPMGESEIRSHVTLTYELN